MIQSTERPGLLQGPGTLAELSKTNLKTMSSNDTKMLWERNYLFVPIGDDFHIYELITNGKSLSKHIQFNLQVLKLESFSPSIDVITDEQILACKKIEDRGKLAADINICPNRIGCMKTPIFIEHFYLSPPYHKNEKILALLTNVGCVILYTKNGGSWNKALSVTQEIVEYWKLFWNTNNINFGTNINQIVNKCMAVNTKAICWHKNNKNLYLFTAQGNGDIFLWSVYKSDNPNEIGIKYVNKYNSNFERISNIKMIIGNQGEELICCSRNGIICALCIDFQNNFNLKKEKLYWPHKDFIEVNTIAQFKSDPHNIILIVKNNFLVLIIEDEAGNFSTQYENINDHALLNLKICGEDIYVCSGDGLLYKISLEFSDSSVNINIMKMNVSRKIEDIRYCAFEICGNGALWAITLEEESYKKSKRYLGFYENTNTDYVSMLVNNPSQKLTNMWDCIELMRFKCRLKFRLPSANQLQPILENPLELYSLKIFLLLIELKESYCIPCHNIDEKLRLVLEKHPKHFVKDTILSFQAVANVKQILTLLKSMPVLQKDRDILMNSFRYLNNYCEVYSFTIEEYLDQNDIAYVTSNIAVIDRINCKYCDEELKGLVCKNNHLNEVCLLTFRILDNIDNLYCKNCSACACKDMVDDNPMCPFCDLEMC